MLRMTWLFLAHLMKMPSLLLMTTTTSRLGPLGLPIAGSRDYTLHRQTVELREDKGTSETLYAIVNRKMQVVEARLPNLPDALSAIVQLQARFREALTSASGVLEFYENIAD